MDLLRTHYIDLSDEADESPHRPQLGFYVEQPDADHPGEHKIVVQLGPMVGQQMRFVELTLDETHRVAKLLIDLAHEVIEAQATARTAPEVAAVLNRDAPESGVNRDR